MRRRGKSNVLLVGILGCLTAVPAASGLAASPSEVVDLRSFAQARLAIDTNDYAALTTMLDAGLSPNAASPEDGYTLLHIAASNGRVDMVRELLSRGADAAAATPRYGFTPVDSAGSNVAIIDMLIAAGGPRPVGYRVANQSRPAPAATAPIPATPSTPASKPKTAREKECAAKHYADSKLCYDSTCRMATYRKWAQCLKTGRYY